MLRSPAFTAPLGLTLLLAAQASGAGLDPVPADTAPVAVFREERPEWDVVLGAGISHQPEYEGSDEMDSSPFPFISLTYGRFGIGPEAFSFEIFDTDRLDLGVSLGYGGGRDPDDIDSGYLDGFAEIDASAIFGARLGYSFGPAEAYVELEHYLGGSDGTSATVGVEYEQDLTARLSLNANLSATFSDDKYMESYFGVTAADALLTGYEPYKAGSGLRRVDLSIGAQYALTERWFVMGEIGVGQLSDDAKDSPIVRDDVQSKATMLVGFRF